MPLAIFRRLKTLGSETSDASFTAHVTKKYNCLGMRLFHVGLAMRFVCIKKCEATACGGERLAAAPLIETKLRESAKTRHDTPLKRLHPAANFKHGVESLNAIQRKQDTARLPCIFSLQYCIT